MKKNIVLIFIILISCGPSKFPVKGVNFVSESPKLNEISHAEIGESLFKTETVFKFDAIIMQNEIILKKGYINRTVKIGEIFIKRYETIDKYLYESNNPYFGIAIPKKSGKPMFYTNGSRIKFYDTEDQFLYENIVIKQKGTNLNKEFIYNGMVENNIKFIYREFKNNLDLPSDSQVLQYDALKGNIIGFKGLRIEIITASNTGIEYKILNKFEE